MTVTVDIFFLVAFILFLVGLIIQTSIANSILESENRILQAECSHNASEIYRLESRVAELEDALEANGLTVPAGEHDYKKSIDALGVTEEYLADAARRSKANKTAPFEDGDE